MNLFKTIVRTVVVEVAEVVAKTVVEAVDNFLE